MKKLIIIKAKHTLCKEHALKWSELHYLGATDCTMIEPGWFQLCFNVMKKNHPVLCYRTTIAYDYKPKEKKRNWGAKLCGAGILIGFLLLYATAGSIEADSMSIAESFFCVSIGFALMFGCGAIYLDMKINEKGEYKWKT